MTLNVSTQVNSYNYSNTPTYSRILEDFGLNINCTNWTLRDSHYNNVSMNQTPAPGTEFRFDSCGQATYFFKVANA